MAETPSRISQSQKIEDARDLQTKLYREIGISAVAAALRFTNQPDTLPQPQIVYPVPGVLRGTDIAA